MLKPLLTTLQNIYVVGRMTITMGNKKFLSRTYLHWLNGQLTRNMWQLKTLSTETKNVLSDAMFRYIEFIFSS